MTTRTHLGDRGDAVTEWQAYLVRHGYDPGAVDGRHGPRTEAATVLYECAAVEASAAEHAAAAATVRERLAILARSYVGCGVTSDRDRYAALVMGPSDPESTKPYFCAPKTSGCALVVRGLWRAAGLRHPLLEMPYRVGHAVEDCVTIARESSAWVPCYRRGVRLPDVGDAVLVGPKEHFYTVVEIGKVSDRLAVIMSVDGGQRDARANQTIGLRHRAWTLTGNGTVVDRTTGESTDPGAGVSRVLMGWCDVSAMPFPRAA